MIYYYKIAAGILEDYITKIDKSDYRSVAAHIGRTILQDKNWVRDDVDYPEAVEAAEMMAFGYNHEWSVDQTRIDGERWVTDECLRHIMSECQKENPDIVGVIVTLINHSPYPDAEYQPDLE